MVFLMLQRDGCVVSIGVVLVSRLWLRQGEEVRMVIWVGWVTEGGVIMLWF